MKIEVDSTNLLNIEQRLADLADEDTMLKIHAQYAKFLEPYVPMDEGVLSHNINITSDYVQYDSPYAHYQYTGIVYGPNIPILENGVIVGWFSRPNEKKHPTGAKINYSTEKHPLATHHWDEAAMDDRGDVFTAEVKDILQKKLREGRNG